MSGDPYPQTPKINTGSTARPSLRAAREYSVLRLAAFVVAGAVFLAPGAMLRAADMDYAIARKALIEAAWAYRMKPRVSRLLLNRQQDVPEKICRISWKAQLRLCGRFRRLAAKGKPRQVVNTAIARELSAFLWAMAKQVQPVA